MTSIPQVPRCPHAGGVPAGPDLGAGVGAGQAAGPPHPPRRQLLRADRGGHHRAPHRRHQDQQHHHRARHHQVGMVQGMGKSLWLGEFGVFYGSIDIHIYPHYPYLVPQDGPDPRARGDPGEGGPQAAHLQHQLLQADGPAETGPRQEIGFCKQINIEYRYLDDDINVTLFLPR